MVSKQTDIGNKRAQKVYLGKESNFCLKPAKFLRTPFLTEHVRWLLPYNASVVDFEYYIFDMMAFLTFNCSEMKAKSFDNSDGNKASVSADGKKIFK